LILPHLGPCGTQGAPTWWVSPGEQTLVSYRPRLFALGVAMLTFGVTVMASARRGEHAQVISAAFRFVEVEVDGPHVGPRARSGMLHAVLVFARP